MFNLKAKYIEVEEKQYHQMMMNLEYKLMLDSPCV